MPHASINFITAHDGFTLEDLVSYNDKHNEANLEDNRDGNNNNLSWNCGVEGPTDDPVIRGLRARQKRNFVATLLLSQGVPMLLAGDEIGRTQRGNNNAYCQDNEVSWISWTLDDEHRRLLDFVRRMVQLRRNHPIFRRRHFFQGRPLHGSDTKDIVWLQPDGTEMTTEEWDKDFARCLGVYLAGAALGETDARGNPVGDGDFVVLFNAHHEPLPFRLPAYNGSPWIAIVDTARDKTDMIWLCPQTMPPGSPPAATFARHVRSGFKSRRPCMPAGATRNDRPLLVNGSSYRERRLFDFDKRADRQLRCIDRSDQLQPIGLLRLDENRPRLRLNQTAKELQRAGHDFTRVQRFVKPHGSFKDR